MEIKLSTYDLEIINVALSTLRNKVKKSIRQAIRSNDDKKLLFKSKHELTIQQINELKNKLEGGEW